MRRPRFRQLPHTADVRLAVWGDSLEELLGNAVAGALRFALGRDARGQVRRWHEVVSWPEDTAAQLVKVVNEALFLLYTRREVALCVRCRAGAASLGTAPLVPGRMPETEVKAATFHALRPAAAHQYSAVLTLDL